MEQGFEEELSFIIGSLPALKKRILTSATEAVDIPAFTGLKDPVIINYVSGEKAPALDVQILNSPDEDKSDTLFNLICMIGDRSSIVFCNQREFVEQQSASLKSKGIVNVFYHGAMEHTLSTASYRRIIYTSQWTYCPDECKRYCHPYSGAP